MCPTTVLPTSWRAWAFEAGTNKPVLQKTKVKTDNSHHLSYLCQRASIKRAAKQLKAAFVAYFEKNYVDNCKDWLRCGAVEGLEKPWLIPTGTQVAESYHAHLKAKDLKGRRVCRCSVLPSLLTPLLH